MPAEAGPGVVAEVIEEIPPSDLSDVDRDKPELGNVILPGAGRPGPAKRGERGGRAGGITPKPEGVLGLFGMANVSGFVTALVGCEDGASPCFISGL